MLLLQNNKLVSISMSEDTKSTIIAVKSLDELKK